MKRTFKLLLFFLVMATYCLAQDNSKNLTPDEGKSLVYFVRPSKLGAIVTFVTTCDDQMVGKTKGNRFVYRMIDSGSHKIVTTGGEKDAELDLVTEANKIYFVEIVPKMGMVMARVRMELLSEKDGRSKLEKCKAVLQK